MRRDLAYVILLVCAVWLLFVVSVNVDSLLGAYGSGPPYYGRTTNMDKWESPLPGLALLDVVSAAVLFFAGRRALLGIRRQ